MKLIIQIPCYNESQTLAGTLADLPREIPGIEEIEYLVIDDGSTDGTSEVARSLGIHHVVRFPQNRGLAKGFMAGVDACLQLGADIIVNTDADNQYCGGDIPALIQPILAGDADLVVGDRQIDTVEDFSSTKKTLQKFGSWVVRLASNTRIPDATSGFRAISREAAMRMFVTSEFTYTLETLIQAGQASLAVTAVPIHTNPKTRDSRLFSSVSQYIRRSASTILRIYTMYRPLKAFLFLFSLLSLGGLSLGVRFLYFHFTEDNTGHVQSLILAAILLISAFMVLLIGLVADLVAANRKLLQDAIIRLRRLEYEATPEVRPPGVPDASPGKPRPEGIQAEPSAGEDAPPESPQKR